MMMAGTARRLSAQPHYLSLTCRADSVREGQRLARALVLPGKHNVSISSICIGITVTSVMAVLILVMPARGAHDKNAKTVGQHYECCPRRTQSCKCFMNMLQPEHSIFRVQWQNLLGQFRV